MKTKSINTIQHSITRVAIIVGGILFIPFILSIHNRAVGRLGWNWTMLDFIIAGTLLGSFGLLIEIVRHTIHNKNYKIAIIVGLILFLLWIWVELAVGLFTNWGS